MNNCSSGVLTERKLTFCSDFGVAKHSKSNEFVVFASFGVVKDFSYHSIVFATKHKCVVVGCLTSKNSQCFRINNEHFVATPILNFYVVRCQVVILSSVLCMWKHLLVFKWFVCHNYNYYKVCFNLVSCKVNI